MAEAKFPLFRSMESPHSNHFHLSKSFVPAIKQKPVWGCPQGYRFQSGISRARFWRQVMSSRSGILRLTSQNAQNAV